jgi:Flp pilus assembly protein TadG
MRQRIPARAAEGEEGSPPERSRPEPPVRKRFRREGGATAVEFALIVPVLTIFVFGIIGFGLAFMQMQTIRGALREGGRAAATGASADEVQDHAYASALGAIDSAGNVEVNPNTGGDPVCTAQTIGEDATVSYDTSHLPGGGIRVTIPFLPIFLDPTLEANFRCEV